MLQAAAGAVAESIEELSPQLGERVGYVIMLFDASADGNLSYGLNIPNDIAIKLLKGWIARVESGLIPEMPQTRERGTA